jgi:hypothetical protein
VKAQAVITVKENALYVEGQIHILFSLNIERGFQLNWLLYLGEDGCEFLFHFLLGYRVQHMIDTNRYVGEVDETFYHSYRSSCSRILESISKVGEVSGIPKLLLFVA